jgi:hypothetical protein
MRVSGLVFVAALRLCAQGCGSVPAWSTCDFAFDLQPGEDVNRMDLHVEFRSPHHRTFLMGSFHDDDKRLLVRFAPTESGSWTYRISSNTAKRLDGLELSFIATESDSPGYIRVANVHHFAYEGTNKQHLWMATAIENFAKMPRAEFDAEVARRAKEKFTHLRVTIAPDTDLVEAAARIKSINSHGMTADLVLASLPADRDQRQAYLAEIAARFTAFNLTWMGLPAFEDVAHGKRILKDAGDALKTLDPYQHPRTSIAAVTSGPLIGDDWMSLIDYGTPDPNIGAVEHQLYQLPGIDSGIKNDRDLWNATMNGQYPASGSGQYMTAWFEFMSGNRYWELEPYFDVDGGRAIALEGVEYIIYIEKPGPVEVTVEKHGYDVAWMDPATGEITKEKKGYNGEHFTGEPPDKAHPWVLHISREGTKEGMLKSWKFESRPVPVQEVEQDPKRTPFLVAVPTSEDISISHPPYYALKVTRDTRGTRSLLVEWTGEVPVDNEGYRVIGTGREGTMHIPPSIASHLPVAISVRMNILNANGKAYIVDKVYRLVP